VVVVVAALVVDVVALVVVVELVVDVIVDDVVVCFPQNVMWLMACCSERTVPDVPPEYVL
jgi:hypothetical protein